MFTLPSILLGFTLSSLLGLAFFIVFGKGWARLGVYWLVSVAAFLIGQAIASFFQLRLLTIGSVNLEALFLSLVALFLVRAFWKIPAVPAA